MRRRRAVARRREGEGGEGGRGEMRGRRAISRRRRRRLPYFVSLGLIHRIKFQ